MPRRVTLLAALTAAILSSATAVSVTPGGGVCVSAQTGREQQDSRHDRNPESSTKDTSNANKGSGAAPPAPCPKVADDRKLLERIERDTGEVISPADVVSTCSHQTGTPDGREVFGVRTRADGGCGDNARLFAEDATQGKLVLLLALKCVDDLRPPANAGSAEAPPDFLYTGGNARGGERYTALFKFRGGRYEEVSCHTFNSGGQRARRPVKCDGRGLRRR